MNRLKELRKEKGITQQELADEIGITKLSVSNWETGKHDIKSDKAQTLADYFGVSVAYLLGYEDNFREKVNKLKNSKNYDDDYYKTFRAYYELKVADGQEFFLSLKTEKHLEMLRQNILKSIIPNIETLTTSELKEILTDHTMLNAVEYKLNDFFFSLTSLFPDEEELLINFIFLSAEDKNNILNLVKSLSKKGI
ncbi:helix-turn-helix domain-containing protein [Streptococcus sp. ZJ93]|uniref:helix-turn-helix domain-containing protein n=1 Tax=Streptococcus handemini TaxID=3161188 RepID=UPI0034D5B2CA